MHGKVIAVCTSSTKGIKKNNVGEALMIANYGLQGDAHGGNWHRQVSLLALESIEKIRQKGLEVQPGDFAENITTQGIELYSLPIGSRITIGDVYMEVTQIGKECHNRCNIFYTVGDCVMPREGIFARVIKGGRVMVGDEIKVGQKRADIR